MDIADLYVIMAVIAGICAIIMLASRSFNTACLAGYTSSAMLVTTSGALLVGSAVPVLLTASGIFAAVTAVVAALSWLVSRLLI